VCEQLVEPKRLLRPTFLLTPLSPVGSTHTGAALSPSVNRLSALTSPSPSDELRAQSAVFFSVLLLRLSSLTPPFEAAGGGARKKVVDGEDGEGWRLADARDATSVEGRGVEAGRKNERVPEGTRDAASWLRRFRLRVGV
jgi:hypothetical protein